MRVLRVNNVTHFMIEMSLLFCHYQTSLLPPVLAYSNSLCGVTVTPVLEAVCDHISLRVS